MVTKILENSTTEWSSWFKRFMIVSLAVVAVSLLVVVWPIMPDIFLALVIAFLIALPVIFLKRTFKLPYTPLAIIIFIGYIILLTFLIFNFIKPLTDSLDTIKAQLQLQVPKIIDYYKNYSSANDSLRIVNEPISNLVKGQSVDLQNILPTLISTTTLFFNGLTSFATKFLFIHFLAFLFLLEIPSAYKFLRRVTPKNYKKEYSILLSKIFQICTRFIQSQLLIASILGLATLAEFTVLGISGGVAVSLFTFIMALIPYIGSLISLIPIGVLPLIVGSKTFPDTSYVTIALIALIVALVVQAIIWNFVAPKIAGDAVNVPVSLIIVGLFVGSFLGGVVGAIISTPIIGILKIILEYVFKKINDQKPYDESEYLSKDLVVRL